MDATAFTGINPTRAAISDALRQAPGEWHTALPALAEHLRGGIAARSWRFLADTAQDLDAGTSATLRAVVTRALEVTADPAAAMRLARRVIDRRDNPELAATVWREAKRQVVGAVWRALRAEDDARRRRVI